MRLFVGIKAGCTDYLTALQQQLKAAGRGNFTSRANLHITLKFLGEVAPFMVEPICKAISQTRSEAFTLAAGEVVVMRKGLVVAEVGGELKKLFKLQSQIETALEKVGFKKEARPYRPHITLARNYRGETVSAGSFPKEPQSFPADEVILFESRREEGRLVYVPLFRHKLHSE